jgi:NADPH2:quinone reductase
MNYATTIHALVDRGALAEGETLLVLGAAGGVGITAVEIGKLLGARVIAAASTEEKLATAKEAGADELVDYTRDDFKQRLKSLGGADVVYDPVGGPYADPALRAIRPKGRYLVVGFAAGDIPRVPLNLPLVKECAIVGVFWGAFAMREPERHAAHLARLLDWYGQGRLRPLVTQRYPFGRAAEALRAIADRQARGKVVLVPD